MIEDVVVAEPGPGEVRIDVAAIGMNRAEVGLREGTYVFNPEPPFGLGFEAAGYINAVGPGVSGLAVGDYVSFIPSVTSFQYCTYGEQAIMPADRAVKTPAEIAPPVAAAMWMAYLTAYGGLVEAGGVRPGENVLLTAPSSSVGLAAIQIVRKLGGVPIAVSRTHDKSKALLAAGAEHVLALTDGPLEPAVMRLTGNVGAHLVFDCVAGDGVLALADAAALHGRIVIYGALSGPSAPFPLLAGAKKGLSMRAFYVHELIERADCLARGKAFILAGVKDGSLKPKIDRSFPFEQVREAHTYLESNQQLGKIVMELAPSRAAK
jgi:NADPH:quinone reductase-like Zn-dependent oxidoreductase